MLKKREVNKKVMNATKVEYDGKLFDSKLEATFAKYLKMNHINYEYNTLTIEVMPKFRYCDEAIRAAKYTPDFVIGDYLIEVKGFPTDAWKVRRKIILHYMFQHPEWKYREVKKVSEMIDVINEIKERGLSLQ